jgi:dihydropteroate synthase
MHHSWRIRSRDLTRSSLPLLMGILNVTPDSFSDGGRFQAIDQAVAQGLRLQAEGADILDIGGESTRRTIPVIRRLAAEIRIPISIDTTKSEVARQALDAGAEIVNDISGLTFDPEMLEVCRTTDAGICVMHIQGTPQTMQLNPSYNNVVVDVTEFLQQQVDRCLMAGIPAERMCIDPGIGFGKTAAHNLQLLRAVPLLQHSLQRPVLIGHSRKRFLARLLGREVDERQAGTIGVSVALAARGVDVLRIHDVQPVRDALVAWQAVSGDSP